VVDTSPFPNIETANKQLLVLREKDANATFNSESTKLLEDLCVKNNISYLYKNRYVESENAKRAEQDLQPNSLGSTELGRIIAASNGLVDGTTIQMPTIGYHTMHESASVESVDAFLDMLKVVSNI
jgi:hypothetical protein